MWSICKFTFTWKPWMICFYYSKAISSLFSPASETEPQVNTINFAVSRYFHVKAMKDLLLSKRFQVYFRPLQKPSRKWIQSISPHRVTFTWKPWKICFYESDFKFIFAHFRNRAASEYNQFRRLASMLRTSSLKLHVLPVYHFLWSAVRLFDYFLEESVKRQAHYFLDSFESPCSTRKTRNPTRSSMLDPREDRGSRIESRSSTRKRLSTYPCPVLYTHLSDKIHAFEKQKEYTHTRVIGLFYYLFYFYYCTDLTCILRACKGCNLRERYCRAVARKSVLHNLRETRLIINF